MRHVSVDERRARLVTRHRLHPAERAGDAPSAASAVVALHSTDPVTVYLSLHARTLGVSPAKIEHALYEERTLVRMLGMRRTLFVVPGELTDIVQGACTSAIAARERQRLLAFVADSDITDDPEAWLTRAADEALRALERRGEAATAELAAEVPVLASRLRLGAGTRYETTQSAASRILFQLAAERHVVRVRPRGSWISSQYRWAPWAAWLGSAGSAADPNEARAELVRRWLAAFGPATETDLRWWGGWTARDTRAALAQIPHASVDLDGAPGIVLADDVDDTPRPDPSASLLPALDPTTMGWKERSWYLGAHAHVLFDRNGNAGPTLWWDGRVVGAWAQRPDGEIAYRVLEDVGAEALAAIVAESERLRAWLGDVRFSPRFRTPLQRELVG